VDRVKTRPQRQQRESREMYPPGLPQVLGVYGQEEACRWSPLVVSARRFRRPGVSSNVRGHTRAQPEPLSPGQSCFLVLILPNFNFFFFFW
jgi:hypothetical protein